MTGDAVGLYTAEALRVHELLDGAGVPRSQMDEPALSMSQRLELLLHARQQEVSYRRHVFTDKSRPGSMSA